MIRLWLSRKTPIPVREQLSAQLILGILSRKLAPGERLPSVRDLARRLKVHANTVSATYRDLAQRGWVSQRRGSGVFVCDLQMPEGERTLETFVRGCVEEGLARGFSLAELQSAFGITARRAATPRFAGRGSRSGSRAHHGGRNRRSHRERCIFRWLRRRAAHADARYLRAGERGPRARGPRTARPGQPADHPAESDAGRAFRIPAAARRRTY